uniref:NADH-quinone oxidoreductase subunit L n=1 Tax=Roseihalotalea indica TaxID=2867963 RepID=A0AA49JHN6_9BACT|nr:NADH-quinone oxidoreductase subunit L [Tunicatimonas sp. TK19036]
MMIATLLLAPFIACILIYLLRKKADLLAIVGALVSWGAALWLMITVYAESPLMIEVAGLPDMPFRLLADETSLIFSVVVATVAFFIFVYARGYMAEEKGKVWFWAGMSLFLAAMQLLVLSADWILFITGWEIMGLASYLLIGTWHWEKSAQRGANRAFMLTRFTDLGLYVGIFIIVLTTGSSRITPTPAEGFSLMGALALLLAVMGKSAQVPFQSWLSGAMAGPTPVSALLHSATMVAAGAILLFRAFPLLPESALPWIGIVGGVTILLTGLTAIVARDVKQMLAASTSSQLGFMLLAVGAGFPGAAFAHWVAHAFMKSSLFLGAGVFQHARDSTAFKDIEGLGRTLKISFAGFAIAGIGLAGVPPFIGYWSKDGILATGLEASSAVWYFSVGILGALLTALYMGRAIRLLWKGNSASQRIEKISWMQAGLVVLVAVVAVGGFWLEPVVQRTGYEIPKDEIAKISGIAVAVAGLVGGWWLHPGDWLGKTTHFLQNNYQLGGGYQQLVGPPVMKLAFWCNRLDQGLHQTVLGIGESFGGMSAWASRIDRVLTYFVERIGNFNLQLGRLSRSLDDAGIENWIAGLASSVKGLGRYSKNLQSGLVHQELLWSVGGMVVLLIILIFSIL